jgi:hypothetical protein
VRLDFLDRLKEYIEGLPNTPSVIEIGQYNEDGNSVAIRPTPSNTNIRDMAKSKIYPFAFQMLVHHKNNYTAYLLLKHLEESLDMSKEIVSEDESYTLISLKCTTNPSHVETTSYGTLWTAVFEAELFITKQGSE